MGILKKNKKGFSLAEIMGAIVIVGLASSAITSMVITSQRGQVRAQQYVLANEIAKTYDAMLARDIRKSNIKAIGQAAFNSSDPNDKYITISADLLKSMTKTVENEYSPVYLAMYSTNTTDHFQLNKNYYDSSNVVLRIYVINTELCFFRTEVIVTYYNDRQVTYYGSHFKE